MESLECVVQSIFLAGPFGCLFVKVNKCGPIYILVKSERYKSYLSQLSSRGNSLMVSECSKFQPFNQTQQQLVLRNFLEEKRRLKGYRINLLSSDGIIDWFKIYNSTKYNITNYAVIFLKTKSLQTKWFP